MDGSGSMKRRALKMRIGRTAVALTALMAASLAVAGSQPQPMEILRQSILSRASVDFSGIRTVVVFDDGEKVLGVQQKIDCDAPANLRIVFLAPDSERGRLCLTIGQEHWAYTPATKRVVHSQLPPPERVIANRLEELAALAGEMRAQYVGVETIAGREAHVIKVYTPRGVPVKKTWVDAEHAVELKTQRFDSHGQVKSSAYYTSIAFSPSFAPGLFEFEPPAGVTVIEAQRPEENMTLNEAQERAGFKAVIPGYLPPGYSFHADHVAVIEAGGKPTIWLFFTNGADTFSLFQREASGSPGPIERERSITWQDGGFCFTLMGTLMAEEARKVKNSIHP